MKLLLLLLGVLLVTQTWAKPKDVEEENEVVEEQEEEEVEQPEGGYNRRPDDPCEEHECPIGQQCDVNKDNKPVCVCTQRCPEEVEDRAKACSTTNVTFVSECELFRQKCLCQKNDEQCEDKEYRHIHMDYYGPCKEITECSEEELNYFPIRMRDWLFLIMKELAKRKDLTKPALKLAQQAEEEPKHWVLPSIWKFCDLDRTHDLFIDNHELEPITKPLKPIEHCTGPFIEKCDADNDGRLELREWTTCLGLDEEDSENMEEVCNTLME